MVPERRWLIALSILLVGGRGTDGRTYQGPMGYDLNEGPVTYEAYYPEVDGQPLEKTYQTPYANYRQFPSPDIQNPIRPYTQGVITPIRRTPQTYVNQYPRETPRTELEEALKTLIDAIRDERTVPNQFYPNAGNIGDEQRYRSLGLEDIFQPRPQVINYVFGKGRNAVVEEKKGETLGGEKGGEAQVAAIEVSGSPHKIRHHHGEKPRHNRVAES